MKLPGVNAGLDLEKTSVKVQHHVSKQQGLLMGETDRMTSGKVWKFPQSKMLKLFKISAGFSE